MRWQIAGMYMFEEASSFFSAFDQVHAVARTQHAPAPASRLNARAPTVRGHRRGAAPSLRCHRASGETLSPADALRARCRRAPAAAGAQLRWRTGATWRDVDAGMRRGAWAVAGMPYERLHSDLVEGFVCA